MDQSATYLLPRKCLKSLFVDTFQITLIIYYRNSNVVLKMAAALSLLDGT